MGTKRDLYTAEIDLTGGLITLPRYPFPSKKTRQLGVGDIAAIVDGYPPMILTRDNEFLFVTRLQLKPLFAFADVNGIATPETYDIWADLLEVFLDTEFGFTHHKRSLHRLTAAGLTPVEIKQIRRRVARRMMWRTVASWEWQHYSLMDVLEVMQPPRFMPQSKWRAFYRRANDIALLGLPTA